METEKTHLKNMTLSEMQEWFLRLGEKKFRALQVFRRIYGGAASFDEMTELWFEAPQQAGRDGGHRFGAPSEKAGVSKRRDEKISL